MALRIGAIPIKIEIMKPQSQKNFSNTQARSRIVAAKTPKCTMNINLLAL